MRWQHVTVDFAPGSFGAGRPGGMSPDACTSAAAVREGDQRRRSGPLLWR
ncbi:hypothetical protein IU427_17620 [Nocardia beijingensis]|nr:hypothetical protein [Nocardia beijingensis]MBF6466987.1 hypothetical protein [Nocardia beijingensis]